jgi:hypothetical protein
LPDFYAANPENGLLLGDVLTGFRLVSSVLDDPGNVAQEIKITVSCPEYFAVMTPCCSIGDKRIALAPLVPIKSSFWTNPYFVDDFTRINHKALESQLTPPSEWQKLSEAERADRESAGLAYGLVDSFVYAPHGLLKRYLAPKKGAPAEAGHYLLEFGSAVRVDCKHVVRNKAVPSGVKVLELTVETRNSLRAKLVNYFGRIPDEDTVAMAQAAG